MEHRHTNRFGAYIRQLRDERNLSIRQLAKMAGLDSGALTRMENGKRRPAPQTLDVLAKTLHVPLTDLLTVADYPTPDNLPHLNAYLHARYGHLPEHVLASMNDYCGRLIDEYSNVPDESVGGEDNTNNHHQRN